MPKYDYRCVKCGKKSTLSLSIAGHEAGKARCPKCGSKRLKQLPSLFFAATSSKS